MTRDSSNDGPTPAQGVEGWTGFAMTVFALAVGLILLLDRIGVPLRLVGMLGPCLAVLGLGLVGLSARTMRISRFYAGGRAMPALNMALAASAMVLALVLPLLPPSSGPPGLASLLAAAAGGLCLAGLVTGPMLRKSGAFSVIGLLAARFPNPWLAGLGGLAAAAIAVLVALAGFGLAADMLALATGLSRSAALVAVAAMVMLVTVPGGIGGVCWTANGAAGLVLGALLLPLALRLAGHETLPVPVLGDRALLLAALERMSAFGNSAAPLALSPSLIAALALGLGCLPSLLSLFATLPQPGKARRAMLTALAVTGLALAGGLALIAIAINGLDHGMVGSKPELLAPIAYAASGRGLLPLCGQDAATAALARLACASLPGFGGLLRAQDIAPSNFALMLGMTQSLDPQQALASIIVAALVALGLVLAASGVQSLATLVAHDGLYRGHAPAQTSRRLAQARLVLIMASAALAAVQLRFVPDPRLMTGAAVLASAALVAPQLGLALWPWASARDALLAFVAGAIALAFQAGALQAGVESAAYAVLLAAGAALATGLAASLLHRGPGAGAAFVTALLRRGPEVLPQDRGA